MRPGHTPRHHFDHARLRGHRLIGSAARAGLPLLVLGACVAPVASSAGVAATALSWANPVQGLNLRASPSGEIRETLPDQAAVEVPALPINEASVASDPVAVATTGEEGALAGGDVAAAKPAGPARALEVRLLGGGHATIDALEDGQLVRSMAAFAGGEAAPTPTGTFAVQAHVESLTTNMWAAKSGHEWTLPYFVQVDGDVGIHGPKIDVRTGQPVPGPSSGCLSPSLADSIWLYDWAAPGTPVHITHV